MKILTALVLFAAAPIAQAQGFSGWAFNQFLYFEFASDPAAYASFVASGSPCYAWIGASAPDSPQPACFYDPANGNAGYAAPAKRAASRRR